MCCPVNVSICFVCCVFDSVCELFGDVHIYIILRGVGGEWVGGLDGGRVRSGRVMSV